VLCSATHPFTHYRNPKHPTFKELFGINVLQNIDLSLTNSMAPWYYFITRLIKLRDRKMSAEDTVQFTLRLPDKLWRFSKKQAIYQKTSLNKIIIKALQEYKINVKKALDEK